MRRPIHADHADHDTDGESASGTAVRRTGRDPHGDLRPASGSASRRGVLPRRVLLARRALLGLLFASAAAATWFATRDADAHTRITTDLTWGEDIREIFREHCMECHSPGGAAPAYVDLTTYDLGPGRSGARSWAKAIEEELLTGRMPPWKADPRAGSFSNRRTLPKQDLDYIIAWVRGGAPQGKARNLPPPEEFADRSWRLGEPDLVIEAPEEIVIPAGVREFEASFTVALPTDFGVETMPGPDFGKPVGARWISGWEFLPGVGHATHSLEAILHDPPGLTEDLEEIEIQKPYDPLASEEELEERRMRAMPLGDRLLGRWARGDAPMLLPDGAGKKLRPGSSVTVRAIYRKASVDDVASEFRDRPRLGLHFTRDQPEYIAETLRPAAGEFRAPTGEVANPVANLTLAESVHLVSIHPRVGPRGGALEVEALFPDGFRQTLLHAPGFERRWESAFVFQEPIRAPAGTVLELRGVVDNTAANRRNPARPPVDAVSGPGMNDEKLEAWIEVTLDDHRYVATPTPTPLPRPSQGSGMVFGGLPDADPTLSAPTDDASGEPRLNALAGVFDDVIAAERANAAADAAPDGAPVAAPDSPGAPAAKPPAEVAAAIPTVDPKAIATYWCPMRTSCGLKDYAGPSKCTVCGMDNIPKEEYLAELRARAGGDIASRTFPWTLTEIGRRELYWSEDRGSGGDMADYPAPGVSRTGARLLHAARFDRPTRTYMCLTKECPSYHYKDPAKNVFYSAGLCPDCEQPVEGQGHMDHTPVHGGQFFMAENLYHHLEGVLESPTVFRLYFFDDWKTPLDPRNFAGRIEIERFDEAAQDYVYDQLPLEYAKTGDPYLTAKLPEGLEFPISFDALVPLAGQEKVFSFYYDTVTEPPPAADPALASGAGGSAPEADAGGASAILAHKHELCPPFDPPTEPAALAAAIYGKERALRARIDAGDLLGLHCDAFDVRAAVAAYKDAIRAKRVELPVADLRALRDALEDLKQGSLLLHEYGHVNDRARVESKAWAMFARGAEGLRKFHPETGDGATADQPRVP